MHVLITRPEDDAASFARSIESLGHRVTSSPLMHVEPVAGDLDLGGVQALIATSRNAVRALVAAPASAPCRELPLFAVGPATAALALEAGFETVIQGPAAARDLVPVIAAHASPEKGVLLHIAGEKLAFDLKGALEVAGFHVRRETVYRARARESLTPEVAAAIAKHEVEAVVLMSPETATIFLDLIVKADLVEPARTMTYFCLSEAVALSLARLGPEKVNVARLPNSQEMLALLARQAPDSA